MTCSIKVGMPALASVPAAVTIYPSMISRAITMLDEDPFLRALPRTVWGVLFRLIKKINVNELQQPIFASRETLAKESCESMPSLSRQLRKLEDEGVITRNQKARAGLKGSSSEIFFTGKAIQAMRLDLPPPGELNQTVKNRSIDSIGSVTYEDTGFVRIGPFRIPADLTKLIHQGGMKVTAVLKLMKVASQAGQKLSEVVAALGDKIFDLHGRQLFAYINTACDGYRNFSAEKANAEKAEADRKQREEAVRQQQRAQAESEKLKRDAQAKKSKLIASLSVVELARLRDIWSSTRNDTRPEEGRVGELIFKTWLRGQNESVLLGNVDNFIHTTYQN
jgi:hypothetical protein